jgi:MGT family glycosyltransferase
MEYSGCLVAEKLGIPHVSIAGNGYSAVDSPDLHYFPGNSRLVAEPMARHRQKLGLPPDPENLMPFRHLNLAFTPPAWDGDNPPRPANTRFVRHTSAAPPGTTLPGWARELDDRPTVFASLGTVFNTTPGALEAIVEGLSAEPINLVVAIGPDQDPARFGPLPANVRLEPYVPQVPLLEVTDLMVTHGGFNSVKEALIDGVPLVVMPMIADQPYNAERAAALGFAEVIAPDNRTAEAVQTAVRKVLQEPSYRAQAKKFQAQMQELPGPEETVKLIEGLALTPSNSSAGAP